jgi:hypothetical protein
MPSNWYRTKNYYRKNRGSSRRWVEFRNLETVTIKAIELWDHRLKLQINGPYFSTVDRIVSTQMLPEEILYKASGTETYRDDTGEKIGILAFDRDVITLDFSRPNGAVRLVRALDIISHQFEDTPFSPALYQELSNIHAFIQNRKPSIHLLPREATTPLTYKKFEKPCGNIGFPCNPIRYLIYFYDDEKYYPEAHKSEQMMLAYLQKLLAAGEDPNGYDTSGHTALHSAMELERVHKKKMDNVIKLLLIYQANPFIRNIHSLMGDYGSAYESALQRENRSYVNYFLSLELSKKYARFIHVVANLPRLTRPVSPPQPFKIKSDGKQMYSVFPMAGNKTYACITKNLNDLSRDEKTAIIAIHKQQFIDDNDTFSKDLSGDDKLIELIYAEHRLIGFNLFQKIKVPECVVISCLYSYLDSKNRHPGLMLLLCFRLAFALQLLMPDQIIGYHFTAINYNSYRLVQDWLHFPKYNPMSKGSQAFPLQKIMKQIYQGSTEVHQEGSAIYVSDEVKTKAACSDALRGGIFKDFFYTILLGISAKASNTNRAAPVFFYVCDDIYLHLKSTLLLSLGIHFFQHVYETAKAMSYLFSDVIKEPHPPNPIECFFNSKMLFWHNVKCPSIIPKQELVITSKL